MICSTCKLDLPEDLFGKNGKASPRRTQCRTCKCATQKANREKARMEAIQRYGGPECAECKSSDRLEINHLHGGGNEHRRKLFGATHSGHRFWIWLKKQGWPAGYNVLCKKCNLNFIPRGNDGTDPKEDGVHGTPGEAPEATGPGSQEEASPGDRG